MKIEKLNSDQYLDLYKKLNEVIDAVNDIVAKRDCGKFKNEPHIHQHLDGSPQTFPCYCDKYEFENQYKPKCKCYSEKRDGNCNCKCHLEELKKTLAERLKETFRATEHYDGLFAVSEEAKKAAEEKLSECPTFTIAGVDYLRRNEAIQRIKDL